MSKESTPAEYFPPGDYIDDELAACGADRAALALAMGIQPSHLHRLCDGTEPILSGVAGRLAAYFGTSPELWMRLSMTYRRRPSR